MNQTLILEKQLMTFEHVEKVYQLGTQRIHALKGVSFPIVEGDFLAIAGASGSGKSTLLNLLSLIDVPTKGKIRYQNIDVATLTDNQITAFRNQHIGIVFQSYNLIPVLNAVENVALALQIQGLSTEQSMERATKMLQEVGLGTHLKHRPANLSGGQKQRVAIARALVTNPTIVIADEPTAALDSKTGKDIIELMRELNYTRNTTFVFSTHDPKIIQNVDHVLHIEDGNLLY